MLSIARFKRRPKSISLILRRFALLSGLSALRARRQGVPRILMLHAVGGEGQETIYPYNHAYETRVFEAELRYLSRHFSIVPLARIVERSRRGDTERCRELALTFDDGLRNSVTVAYPILRRLALPATFFVCPGLIESGEWQWAYEMSARLTHLSPAERADLLPRVGAPTGSIDRVMRWMKNLDTAKRVTIQKRIGEATSHFAPTATERFLFDTMTWQDLASLDSNLITIGSHSMSHPILSKTDPEQLKYEIVESRRVLERRLERPINYFCYPDGAYDDSVVKLVRQEYLAAVTTDVGCVSASDDVHLLARIGAGEEDVHDLAWRLHRPNS
jgi:peptidoglycan/xylan/chitin deacetylase (PgdA/CDA1 family)